MAPAIIISDLGMDLNFNPTVGNGETREEGPVQGSSPIFQTPGQGLWSPNMGVAQSLCCPFNAHGGKGSSRPHGT